MLSTFPEMNFNFSIKFNWLISPHICVNPLPDNISDQSKLKQFADNNFKFDENSRKFSKRVENTVG